MCGEIRINVRFYGDNIYIIGFWLELIVEKGKKICIYCKKGIYLFYFFWVFWFIIFV